MYDFQTIHSRAGRASEKWAAAAEAGCPPGITPLSVADMEFRTAPEIVEAVEELARYGLWGYTGADTEFKNAVCGWMQKRHGWQPRPEWLVPTSGVVAALYAAVRAYTAPGDKIIIQPPVYPPFFRAVEENERQLLPNPLVKSVDEAGRPRWNMDLEGLWRLAPQAKMLVLCSPHNPVGRVWSAQDIEAVAKICHENGVFLLSDEIHCDLLLPGQRHHSVGCLPEELLQNALVATSASKTFSLAGLACSSIFIPNTTRRQRFEAQLGTDGNHFNSAFGVAATKAACQKGEPWLAELLEQINANYRFLADFLASRLPQLALAPLEGTYLAWVDFSALGLGAQPLQDFLQKEARLFINPGASFGAEGQGHGRINLACPASVLEQALERLYAAAQKRGFVS